MKRTTISNYYKKLCELEGLTPLPVKFTKVGKGGAALTFMKKSLKPLYISFDVDKMTDPEYALYHELAHQVCLEKYNNYGHNAQFKKEFNRINDKYMYSNLSMKYLSEMKHDKTHLIMDKMLQKSIQFPKKKRIDEMVVLPLDSLTGFLPTTHGHSYSSDSREDYRELLIDLAKTLNTFWKSHDIKLSVRTK